jgi:membrane associated rhomboid family serine protease
MQQFGLPKFSFHHNAHKLAVGIVAASVIFQLLGPRIQSLLAFVPPFTIYNLEIWRVFSALLIAQSPMQVIFGALIIYSLGSTLEYTYGQKKFLYMTLGLPLLGNVLTLFPALLFPSSFLFPYFGAHSIVTTLWIVYGLRSEQTGQQLNFWGIPLQGRTFALIGFGFVLLQGVFSSFLLVLPDLFSAMAAYGLMMRGGKFELFSRIESFYFSWKLKRMKAKRGMHVVTRESPQKKDDYTIH